jgi:hypothetical protein
MPITSTLKEDLAVLRKAPYGCIDPEKYPLAGVIGNAGARSFVAFSSVAQSMRDYVKTKYGEEAEPTLSLYRKVGDVWCRVNE